MLYPKEDKENKVLLYAVSFVVLLLNYTIIILLIIKLKRVITVITELVLLAEKFLVSVKCMLYQNVIG